MAGSTLPDLIRQLNNHMTPQVYKPRLTIEALAEIDRRLSALESASGAAVVARGGPMTDEEVHALAVEAGGPTGCGACAEVACTGMTTAGHVCGKEPMVVMFSVREGERTDVCVQAQDDVTDALRASVKGTLT